MKVGIKPSELDVKIEEERATADQSRLEERRVRGGEVRERGRESEMSQVT